ncbi:MAG: hypothetical protein RL398_969 [Planctomycetota bacterium]
MALVGSALLMGCGGEAAPAPAAAPTSGIQAASFDFGRSVCGVCCIGIMRDAFSPVDGFVDVEAKIGSDPRFTVKYDAAKTNRDELLRVGKAMIPALK